MDDLYLEFGRHQLYVDNLIFPGYLQCVNVQKKTKLVCPSNLCNSPDDQELCHGLRCLITMSPKMMTINRDVMYGWCSKCRAKLPDEYNKLEG